MSQKYRPRPSSAGVAHPLVSAATIVARACPPASSRRTGAPGLFSAARRVPAGRPRGASLRISPTVGAASTVHEAWGTLEHALDTGGRQRASTGARRPPCACWRTPAAVACGRRAGTGCHRWSKRTRLGRTRPQIRSRLGMGDENDDTRTMVTICAMAAVVGVVFVGCDSDDDDDGTTTQSTSSSTGTGASTSASSASSASASTGTGATGGGGAGATGGRWDGRRRDGRNRRDGWRQQRGRGRDGRRQGAQLVINEVTHHPRVTPRTGWNSTTPATRPRI